MTAAVERILANWQQFISPELLEFAKVRRNLQFELHYALGEDGTIKKLGDMQTYTLTCIDNTGYEDRLTIGKTYSATQTAEAKLVEVTLDGDAQPMLKDRFKQS